MTIVKNVKFSTKPRGNRFDSILGLLRLIFSRLPIYIGLKITEYVHKNMPSKNEIQIINRKICLNKLRNIEICVEQYVSAYKSELLYTYLLCMWVNNDPEGGERENNRWVEFFSKCSFCIYTVYINTVAVRVCYTVLYGILLYFTPHP